MTSKEYARLVAQVDEIRNRRGRADGGPGSGNFGHKGVPGQVGGSAPSDGNASGANGSKTISPKTGKPYTYDEKARDTAMTAKKHMEEHYLSALEERNAERDRVEKEGPGKDYAYVGGKKTLYNGRTKLSELESKVRSCRENLDYSNKGFDDMNKTIEAEGGYDGSQVSAKTGKMLTYSKKEIDDAIYRSDRATRIYDQERAKIERKLYSYADEKTRAKADRLFRTLDDEQEKRELLWSYAKKNRPEEYKKLKEQDDNAREEMRVITNSTGSMVRTLFSDGDYRPE